MQSNTTPAHLSLAALALLLRAARLDGYSQGYVDAQPLKSYADAKAVR